MSALHHLIATSAALVAKCQSLTSEKLFEHLVGAGEQRWRHDKAEGLGGL